jgi:membrane protease YdiL (CAAX protease family)
MNETPEILSTKALLASGAAISLSGAALFLALPAADSPVYFFAAPYYLVPVMILSLLAISAGKLGKPAIALASWASATTFFCFGCFEIVYSWLPAVASGIKPDSAQMLFLRELIAYGGNRSLQIMPIGLLALMLAWQLKSLWRHRLKAGNPAAETTVLGEQEKMSWRRASVRISFYLALVSVAFILAKGTAGWHSGKIALFSARVVGGAANSLVEELLFRGLLQPVFETSMGPGAANLLQAAFFSIIHYGFIETLSFAEIWPELVKFFLYLGIGLFLGRAARETDGLLIPWLFHFFITSAIWLTLSSS